LESAEEIVVFQIVVINLPDGFGILLSLNLQVCSLRIQEIHSALSGMHRNRVSMTAAGVSSLMRLVGKWNVPDQESHTQLTGVTALSRSEII
jgi:hypothetical protein